MFSLFGLLIYLVLVPISGIFLLKDKETLMMAHVLSLLPKDRPLLDAVGSEMNAQLGNYVRGKAIEILVVGAVSLLPFCFSVRDYAALLSVVVGLSYWFPLLVLLSSPCLCL